MKYSIILFFILLLSLNINAQEDEVVVHKMEKEVTAQLDKECKQLLEIEQDTSTVIFFADTAYVERLL